MRAWIAAHKGLFFTGVALAVVGAIVTLTVFQPQKLFIDDEVNEALPTATAQPTGSTSPSEGPVVLARGDFRNLNHESEGSAVALRLADGRRIVRFEDFSVDNGPDLFVYLSSAPLNSPDDDDFNKDFVSLGRLKGNKGSQNYEVPASVDLAKYARVVIWCKRFASGFAVAGLTA